MKDPLTHIREQELIDEFPDNSRRIPARQKWEKLKKDDDKILGILTIVSVFSGFFAVTGILVYWPPEFEYSPIVGLVTVVVGLSLWLCRKAIMSLID
jgi:hypothetical protein